MEIEIYETNNLYLSAYLYASGLQLSGYKQSGKSIYFCFSPKAKAERLVSDYFGGNIQVNPRELFARLHDLKDIVFSILRGEKHE